MTNVDVGVDFWLRYVEASGGLTESGSETTLVMLPPDLQATLELPEVLRVTTDPDIAREDGATLLSVGHPALSRAADDVLAVGDVAAMTIPVPATPPPPAQHLQAMARDQFSIEHGRIDVTGAPARAVRTILRVGVLVDYTLSSDDHYQECVECWVDVPSQRELAPRLGMRLAALTAALKDGSPSIEGLITAIGCADQVIERCARRRRGELGSDIDKIRDAELERVDAYYRDALATIERRHAQAPADRRKLLDARADSVRTEHVRRICETRDKYTASHQVRPYRLHLYEVPVWRLPVDVRRGDRRYPLTLDWLIPLGRFTDVACPHCGAAERLVATKTRLGCAGCVPRPAVRLAAAPPSAPEQPAPKAERPVVSPSAPRQPRPPARTDPRLTPAKCDKLGAKLAGKVWEAVVRNDRRLARFCAPDSPAAAAVRLYGPSGAAWAVGISPTEQLTAVACAGTVSAGLRHTSNGWVETTAGHRFPFLLRWQPAGDTGQVDEILPYNWPVEPAHLSRWMLGPGRHGVYAPPQPRIPLSSVGALLWRRVPAVFGLPAVLRCMAALWRLPGEELFLASHDPAALAAGIERMVCRRANLIAGRFTDVAIAYHINEAAIRAADAELQKCLRLSPQQWW
jgi:ribosomal 50S subunit-associated protein YjgA (DUF615 family)